MDDCHYQMKVFQIPKIKEGRWLKCIFFSMGKSIFLEEGGGGIWNYFSKIANETLSSYTFRKITLFEEGKKITSFTEGNFFFKIF